MTYVAVDVDWTLTHSNMSFSFGRYLYKQNVISLFDSFRLALIYAAHAWGFLSMERLHASVFQFLFAGKKSELIERLADQFFEQQEEGFFRGGVKQEISQLLKKGERVALLSSSPDFLVQRVARHIGVEEWYATEYVVEKGIFTRLGKIVTGSEKAKIASHIRSIEGFSIMVFTDSALDLPLAQMADHVVAVCPDRKLLQISREKGWRVVNG